MNWIQGNKHLGFYQSILVFLSLPVNIIYTEQKICKLPKSSASEINQKQRSWNVCQSTSSCSFVVVVRFSLNNWVLPALDEGKPLCKIQVNWNHFYYLCLHLFESLSTCKFGLILYRNKRQIVCTWDIGKHTITKRLSWRLSVSWVFLPCERLHLLVYYFQ